MIGAYSLKFENTFKWDQMQGVLIWIKQTIPSQEREYDPETKTWYIHEKYVDKLKELIELMHNDFDLEFVSKPDNQTYTAHFVPTETYLEIFKKISGIDISKLDISEAKKIYRRTSMYLHPDKNPDRPDISARMYELNEAWDQLQIKHFKTKELVQQL